MKLKLLLLLLISLPFSAKAQTLSGVVYDEKNETIPGASVYLDGTSTGTVTDADGKYTLIVNHRINTALVVSFMGYERKIISDPFENPVQKIILSPKATVLNEVTVRQDGFKRADMLKIFRQEFLGKTKAGKASHIENEDAIDLVYDYNKNSLSATADVPLLVQNDYLGYRIEFGLIVFNVQFNRRSIRSEDIGSSTFYGTSLFAALPDVKKSFAKRRKDTYFGSQMHFFRNLAQNRWGKGEFELFDGKLMVDPTHYFTVANHDGFYEIKLKDNSAAGITVLGEKRFYKRFNLLYRRKDQSFIVFTAPLFHIDSYGNNDKIEHISFGGEMGKYRLANMLPMDYEP